MIAEKRCKGQSKAFGFDACGKLVPANTRKHGLCYNCWPKFLSNDERGRIIVEKALFKVSKPRLDMEQAERQEKENKGLKAALIATKERVHEFVRLRDKGKPCPGCDVEWNSDFQASHFYKAETFTTLKFHLDNIHSGCVRCNIFLDGNFDNYALRLPKRIGQEKYNALVELAQIDKHFDKVWDLDKLKAIRDEVKILKKQLLASSK